MIETDESSVERPDSPTPRTTKHPYRPSTEHVDAGAGGPLTRVRLRGPGRAGARGVAAVTTGVLAVMALLVTAAPSAFALPAVRPLTESGKVPALGLDMVDGAALHCPKGVTTWSPMIVPVEMAIPRGKPNGTIDPVEFKNMPDDSALWYRALGDTRSGGSMLLDRKWTQDGRRTIPITRTGLRSGNYLLGALCATPDKGRHTYPLDSRGDLIGEWYVVTFTWIDKQPAQGTFHFDQQYAGLGAGSDPTAQPVTKAVRTHQDTSGGMGWPGRLAIAAVLGLALLIGVGLGRRRRGPA